MTTETVADEIETFVREHFEVPRDDVRFSRRINLWDEGYVDSMGVVEMIDFLERRFGVTIPDEVLFSPDFTSIEGIAGFVLSLRDAGAESDPDEGAGQRRRAHHSPSSLEKKTSPT